MLRKDDVPPSALLSQANPAPLERIPAVPTPTEPAADKPAEKKNE